MMKVTRPPSAACAKVRDRREIEEPPHYDRASRSTTTGMEETNQVIHSTNSSGGFICLYFNIKQSAATTN